MKDSGRLAITHPHTYIHTPTHTLARAYKPGGKRYRQMISASCSVCQGSGAAREGNRYAPKLCLPPRALAGGAPAGATKTKTSIKVMRKGGQTVEDGAAVKSTVARSEVGLVARHPT